MQLSQAIRNELIYYSALGMGRCSPNPPVACILLVPGKDRGDYELFGGATESPHGMSKRHAESVCLDQYQKRLERKEFTSLPGRLYLSLEPCSQYGRTPPCTERIIANSSIDRVLAWESDPFLETSGIEVLKKNRCRASFLLPRQSSQERRKGSKNVNQEDKRTSLGHAFLQGFFNRVNAKGPRFHLKAACTQEGVIGLGGQKLKISKAPALAFSHLLRAKIDAVLVAMGTIVSDHPRLHLRPELIQALAKLPRPHHPSFGKPDLFCQTLLNLSAKLGQFSFDHNLEYQPERIFLLGRYDAGLAPFFAMQQELARQTQKKSIFFIEEPYAKEWKSLRPDLEEQATLPALKDTNFSQALRTALAERGYNEVLIEGGGALFSSLQNHLMSTDRIYILRSESSIRHLSFKAKTTWLPEFMQEAPMHSSYELLQDRLELRTLG